MTTTDPRFDQVPDDEGMRLLVAGELDIATVDEFREQLESLVDHARSPVFVDLSGVAFIDSSNIAALLAAHFRAQEVEAELVVVDPSPACRRVFGILELENVLHIAS